MYHSVARKIASNQLEDVSGKGQGEDPISLLDET